MLDWSVVIFWILGSSLVGIYFGRQVKTPDDYLLAGRRLSWWQVSVAQNADAVDTSDFLSAAGLGYRPGMTGVGVVIADLTLGFVAFSRYVIPSLYQRKLYTNAEFLEQRYAAGLRLFSMIIQTLYRIVAITLMVYATALMFRVLLDLSLWNAVGASMAATMVYSFFGGQRVTGQVAGRNWRCC